AGPLDPARGRRRLRPQPAAVDHPLSSRRVRGRQYRRLHGRTRRRPAGDQALAAQARGRAAMSGALATSAAGAALSEPEQAAIDEFCDQLWLEHGLAATSLASYRQDLKQWARWLA